MDLPEGFLLHNMSGDVNGETMSDGDYETRSKMLLDLEVAFDVLAFIMVAVGIIANSVIIVSGWRLPTVRKKTVISGSRYYIMNLALADLGVMVVAPITNLVYIRRSWNLGSFTCKMLLPLRDVFMLVSLVTIPVLGLERYWLITRPLQHVPNKRVAKFIIFGIWLLSYFVNGVPLLIITRVVQIGEVKFCEFTWPSEKIMKVHICFGVAIILTTFVIVVFSYIAIARTLKKTYTRRGITMSEGCGVEGNDSVALILRSRRLVKMLIVLMVTFSICTLPGVSYVLAHVFHDVTFKNQEVLYAFFNGMMIAGSALNPVILLVMASEYRLCIVECLEWLRRWGDLCFHCCTIFKEESPEQPYHEIIRDKNQPTTPV